MLLKPGVFLLYPDYSGSLLFRLKGLPGVSQDLNPQLKKPTLADWGLLTDGDNRLAPKPFEDNAAWSPNPTCVILWLIPPGWISHSPLRSEVTYLYGAGNQADKNEYGK